MPGRHGSVADRLWPKVNKTETCWVWTAQINDQGYGVVYDGQRKVRAHRVSYELHKGPIPEGLVLDHLCRNRACVNPDHLEPVTERVNILRGVGFSAVNAAKTACPQGHAYDELNTYVLNGHRYCRACNRAKWHAGAAKRAAAAR